MAGLISPDTIFPLTRLRISFITRLNRSKQLTLIGIFEEVPVSAGAQGESKKNIYGSGFFGKKLAFHRPEQFALCKLLFLIIKKCQLKLRNKMRTNQRVSKKTMLESKRRPPRQTSLKSLKNLMLSG